MKNARGPSEREIVLYIVKFSVTRSTRLCSRSGQQNLGLRIVPKAKPYEVHVIDSVEMPTAN
jgi:hypothetical protein